PPSLHDALPIYIHYQLIDSGYSHRQTVLIIYAFSALFGLLGILFSEVSFEVSFLIAALIYLLLHLFAEMAGLVLGGKRPLINFITKPFRGKGGKDAEGKGKREE